MSPPRTAGRSVLPLLLAVLALLSGCGHASDSGNVILATTTSTQDSGLLDGLLPLFEARTGYRVKTIAVGTGEALAMGSRGDADVLLVHAPEREREVVDAGYTINRRVVMHNDFLIVGPEEDPAGIHGQQNGAESLRMIAHARARFVSRGDDSGTHLREVALWTSAGMEPEGDWFLSTGQGMGATLMIATERDAYVLTDRGTYLAFRGRVDLVPHVEGDPSFLNIYSVLEVNPERFPEVNGAGARAFADFILSQEAQEIIGDFRVEEFGEALFFPDAGRSGESPGRPPGEGPGGSTGDGP